MWSFCIFPENMHLIEFREESREFCIDIDSWTCCSIVVTMSRKCIDWMRFQLGTIECIFTGIQCYSLRCESDTIFFSNENNGILETSSLISIEMDIFEIPDEGNTDTSFIIPRCMTSGDIIPSRSSLINGSSLSYDIVISYISPPSGDSVILVDITEIDLIACLHRLYILSGMMDHDTVD